jgi:hypothetical protein
MPLYSYLPRPLAWDTESPDVGLIERNRKIDPVTLFWVLVMVRYFTMV